MKNVGPKEPPGAPHPSDTLLAKNFAQVIAASIPMPNSPAIALLITGYPSDKFCGSQIAITPTTASPASSLTQIGRFSRRNHASVALKNRM